MRIRSILAATIAGLSLVACGQSAPATPSGPVTTVMVSLTDFKIGPAKLTAPAGNVRFVVSNDGQSPHNLTLNDSNGDRVGATADLQPHQTGEFTVKLSAGSYVTFCSLPGHRSLGMEGTLTAT